MPVFQLADGPLLDRAVEPLVQLSTEGIINYSLEELSLVVTVPSGLVKAALRIKSWSFVLFDCKVNRSPRLDLERFYEILHNAFDEYNLTITGGLGDSITVDYHFIEGGFYNQMIMKQIYNENVDIYEFQYEYDVVVGITSVLFRRILLLRHFGRRVYATIRNTEVKFEVDEVEMTISKANDKCIIGGVPEGDFFFLCVHSQSCEIIMESIASVKLCVVVPGRDISLPAEFFS